MKQQKQDKKINVNPNNCLSSREQNLSLAENSENRININCSNINAFLGEFIAHSSCVGSVMMKDKESNRQFYNPETCLLSLYRALFFIQSLKAQNKTEEGKKHFFKRKLKVLFLNTNPEFAGLVTKNAQYCSQDYINTKWVGGTLSNWRKISKSIQAFQFFQWKWKSLLEEKTFLFPRLEKLRKAFSGFLNPYKKKKTTKKQDKKKKTLKNSLTVGDLFFIPEGLSIEKNSLDFLPFRRFQYINRNQLLNVLSEKQKQETEHFQNQQFKENKEQEKQQQKTVNSGSFDHDMLLEFLRRPNTRLQKQRKVLDQKASKQKQLSKKPKRFFSMLKKKPDLIVVLDPYFHKIAIHEAQLEKIPVIGFVNSDANIKQITYPIYGNNQSHVFVHFCLNWIARMVKKINTNSKGVKGQLNKF